MQHSGSTLGHAARLGEEPVHTGSAGSEKQPDMLTAIDAAGQAQTAFHAGSTTPTTPWLPRPEATYQAAGSVRASASLAVLDVHGVNSSSAAEASTELLTAKAAFYRMRAALRSGDPSTALQLFSPDAQASGLSPFMCWGAFASNPVLVTHMRLLLAIFSASGMSSMVRAH